MTAKTIVFFVAAILTATALRSGEVSVADYPTIHDAVKANPGRILHVPTGVYEIDRKIHLATDRSGLVGPGKIVQTNPESPIIEIEHATDVTLRDLTLTRADDKTNTPREGILAIDCRELRIENVRVLDNRTRDAAISLRECADARIKDCLVRNYMKIDIDDRTNSPLYGYAFHCIDGTGIAVRASTGTVIQGNRVVEENLLPTPENKVKFKLGSFVKKNPDKGSIIGQQTWDDEYVNNWHQGSAMIVTSPERSDRTQIVGNTIENAAQGIDLHCDHVIVSGNIVVNSFMGMKAMHGSRNVLIIGNQFIRNDLWSIGLMPGASSHAAGFEQSGVRNETANTDGGSIIANNIVSDFGRGDSHWIWGNDGVPFKFDTGQLPHNPPLENVVVTGNVLDDSKADGEPPLYRYAVVVPTGKDAPRNIRFSNNIFPPGHSGVANIDGIQ